MIVERAELTVQDGKEAEFADLLKAQGIALLKSAGNCRSVAVGQGVENPGKFILLLEWDSVADHQAFVASPDHGQFSKLVGPYLAGGIMEHFDMFD